MNEFVGGRPLPRAVTTLGYELSWADVTRGEAEVFFNLHGSRSLAFLDSSLYTLDGELLATATATARIVRM
jgi:hypothetical protein